MVREVSAGERNRQAFFWLLLVIALVLSGWALTATAAFTIPIMFAFFVAIAIAPVDGYVRERLPTGMRWLGHAVSMLILIVILGAFFTGIGMAARQVIAKFPGDFANVGQMLGEDQASENGDRQTGGGTEDRQGGQADTERDDADATDGAADSDSEQETGDERPGDAGGVLGQFRGAKDELGELLRERATDYAGTIVNRTASFLASLVLVLFLALFLLIEARDWREKATAILTDREESQWMRALDRTARNVRWFVVVKTIIGLISGALYVGWLAVMGLDLLLVWGVITFLLSYIPVIGSLIAGILAAGYAFYQLDLQWAIITALGLLVIEQVMGNYVEPRFLGRQLSLSSFMVLVSLLIWGWLWGAAGALLATPILILILNIGAHIRSLRPLAVLLSEHGEETVQAIDAKTK